MEQLESLDLEILEDIDEEYADKLEFNDIEEVLEDEPKLEKVTTEKSNKLTQKTTDETILDELVKMGRTQDIGRSTFKDLGIKTILGWETVIGKYCVTRTSVFRYQYEVKILK